MNEFDKVVGSMIFVFIIVLLLMFFNTGFVKTEALRETAREKLDSVDVSHLLLKCLKENGVVKEERLDSIFSKIRSECHLNVDFFTNAIDVEDGSKWSFGKEREGMWHDVAFTIQKRNGEFHIGEIHVVI